MLTVDEIEALTDTLTDAMKHVVMRCSEGGWSSEETNFPRTWPDVVYGRSRCSFRKTVEALERRGIVKVTRPAGMCAMVALTREGRRIHAALRLRGCNAHSFET